MVSDYLDPRFQHALNALHSVGIILEDQFSSGMTMIEHPQRSGLQHPLIEPRALWRSPPPVKLGALILPYLHSPPSFADSADTVDASGQLHLVRVLWGDVSLSTRSLPGTWHLHLLIGRAAISSPTVNMES